jgi:hypothetical protein
LWRLQGIKKLPLHKRQLMTGSNEPSGRVHVATPLRKAAVAGLGIALPGLYISR